MSMGKTTELKRKKSPKMKHLKIYFQSNPVHMIELAAGVDQTGDDALMSTVDLHQRFRNTREMLASTTGNTSFQAKKQTNETNLSEMLVHFLIM